MNKLVVFDIDNVLADFEVRLVEDILMPQFGYESATRNRDKYSLQERWGSEPEVISEALDFTDDPNSYYGLKPIKAMVEFAQACEEQGAVMYVSSRPEDGSGRLLRFTARWLVKKGLLSNPDIHTVFTGVSDKAEFLSDLSGSEDEYSVDFIVEDSPETIAALKKFGFSVYCFDRLWNKGIFPRIYDKSGTLYIQREGSAPELLYEEAE